MAFKQKVEDQHFVCKRQDKATVTFSKGAALSSKKASSPVASDHCCDQMLRQVLNSVLTRGF